TSTTQTYFIEDNEVVIGTTYYYWLEAVDMTHSTFFGPQYVEVTGTVTPELPTQTVMKSAYPNPFKASANTNINVEVKAGESGTVTIYNVLGQVVKTFNVNEGLNPLKWNGKDHRGNTCGSGIYFYKLSTPSMNQTKKMVIVK
ncbi:MAG: T9SS type A sorting domain-containing protein, partial [Candidatus Cloacimonetes bacterium]|nr:T9SS type A sorting domain-containing protein [Candidatus Cloacimonadota bacterium]